MIMNPKLNGKIVAVHGLTPAQNLVKEVDSNVLRVAGAAYVGMVAYELQKGKAKNTRLATTLAGVAAGAYAPVFASVAALFFAMRK